MGSTVIGNAGALRAASGLFDLHHTCADVMTLEAKENLNANSLAEKNNS